MSKKYRIKTIKDISDIATVDNLDNFVEDFKKWLQYVIAYKHGKEKGLFPKNFEMDTSKFSWIDDGKHEEYLNIKFTKK